MESLNGNLTQLNELIDLAEKSSEQSISYGAKITRYQNNLIISVLSFPAIIYIAKLFIANYNIGSYDYGYAFKNRMDIAFALIIIIMPIILLKFFFEIQHIYIEYRKERKILIKLLEMIDELKRYVFIYEDVNAVQKALIEMRLSRISFSSTNIPFPLSLLLK